MGIKIPEGIPDSTNLPSGIYDFKIESFEPVDTNTGKLALRASLRVLKGPPNTKGLAHNEQFTIGSNDDPQAKQDATWFRFGAIEVKKMCAKAGVKFSGDLDRVAQELEGQKVTGRIVYTVDERKVLPDGTTNPYYGNSRSQAKEWFEPGEREPGATPEPSKAGGKSSAPKAAPKAPPPPDEEEEEEEEPAPKRGSKSRRPVEEEEDDD